MSQILPLRPYQRMCLESIRDSIAKGVTRPAVEMATGLGKTIVFAHLIKDFLAENPEKRALALVHTDELASQAVDKIRMVAPHLKIGVEKAQFRHESTDNVVVGSVQTLRNPERTQINNVGLIIVDEAHHATANSYRTILRFYNSFGDIPNCATVPSVGFSATMARNDGQPLGEIWQDVVFARSTAWAVRKGFLANPVGRRIVVPDLDLSGVSGRNDYRDDELGEALTHSLAPSLTVEAWLEHVKGCRTVLFAPTVAAAEMFVYAFQDAGINASVIHGGMPLADRRFILAEHRAGVFPVLANCMILTEGYDDPGIECVIMARPTRSKGLYIQCVGRGLRIDPTRPPVGQECLILDVAGNAHDLCSLADLSTKPVKEPRDGQDLLSLEDEFDAGLGVDAEPEEYYTGPVEVTEFDLLSARSARNWLKTHGGTYFMKGGTDAYVFLVEREDIWKVGFCGARGSDSRFECCDLARRCTCGKYRRVKGGWLHDAADLEMAMAWGEDAAVDLGANPHETYAKKTAPWRKRKPSDDLRALAASLSVKVRPEDRAGVVSDRVSSILASRRIDPIVRKFAEVTYAQ